MLSLRPGSRFAFRRDAAPRIAVGRVWQETNAFNPQPTRLSDFDIRDGQDVFSAFRNSTTPLAGIIDAIEAMGGVAVPTLAATARPGGRVEDKAFGAIRDRMVALIAKARPDAVCLELHGAIATAATADAEGELLDAIRREIGPDVPIVAALDLHGHVTDRMVEAADLLTGYRTQPHSDLVETGVRAAHLLAEIMDGRIQPVAKRVRLPFLALSNDETTDPPLLGVARLIGEEAERWGDRLVDLSIFNVHPFLDAPDMGQVVLAYADRDPDLARDVAGRIGAALGRVKHEFVATPGDPLETLRAMLDAGGGGGPIVIGDQGDSVLAGTPGDSVEIARLVATEFPSLRGLFPVFDPIAVAAARDAGLQGSARLALGAGVSPGLSPFEAGFRVEGLNDGAVVNTGAYMKGVGTQLGPSAVLSDGPRRFLVTSLPPSVCDPALIEKAGLAPNDLDVLSVKSGNHFKLSFPPPYRCVVAATAGLSNRDPRNLRHRAARPIYPIDPV